MFCTDFLLREVVMGWPLVISMPSSERASLVRAMECDEEAVPGFQERSQHLFGVFLGCLTVLSFPLLKGSLPHPVTADFHQGRQKYK